ncbi:MAG: ACT domain-containing protein [Firmicutes bacterium]|nr:ACT domain-containing protein [Bacillota bacterium]
MAYELSVFVENKPGKLERITKILAENGINLRSFSVASAGEFGVVKIFVNEVDRAEELLRQGGFTVTRRHILVALVPDEPGGLHGLLAALSQNEINVEDCYGFPLRRGNRAAIVVDVEKFPPAEEVLRKNGFKVLNDEELRDL